MFTVKREKERGGVYSRTGREGGGVNAAREKGELSGECWKDRDNVYSTGRRERWVFTGERGRQHWRGKGGGGQRWRLTSRTVWGSVRVVVVLVQWQVGSKR